MAVSEATKRNWKKLNTGKNGKLLHGANKSSSGKSFYPLEYVTDPASTLFLDEFTFLCRKNNISREDALFSLALLMLEKKNILHKENVKKFLLEYPWKEQPHLMKLSIPSYQRDLPGLVYQSLLTEGEKNHAGAYYTPLETVRQMIFAINYAPGKRFLDPCCGSGSFLLAFSAEEPELLYACDKDPLAVFITKLNLLCKYAHCNFTPQVYCCDFLEEKKLFSDLSFDFIATNPPWGAEKNKKHCGKKGNTFQFFYEKSFTLLKEGGRIVFLFPEAVLNIRTHKNLREFILTQTGLEKISFISGSFTSVMTKYVFTDSVKGEKYSSFLLEKDGEKLQMDIPEILKNKNLPISFIRREEEKIIRKMDEKKVYDLSGSIFAMGIVTGDNARKIKTIPENGMEKIYTGKEICRYMLKKAEKSVFYDPENFQQCAKEEYYRREEKLVYKFISRFPVFAYDPSGSLFLNSANILIPSVPGMGIKTVLAFLNSRLFRFYYDLKFADMKILKSNLLSLPFPAVEEKCNKKMEDLVNEILAGKMEKDEEIQKIVYERFGLDENEIGIVEEYLEKSGEKKSTGQ